MISEQQRPEADMLDVPRTLVLGFDFSGCAEVALDQCLNLSRTLHKVTLHVVWVPQYPLAALEPFSLPVEHHVLTEQLKEHIAQRALATKDRGGFGEARVAVHVASGAPARVLCDYAFFEDADLVVVGTHGRTGLERLLLGSVASDVVAMAPCPVLIARPKSGDLLPKIEAPPKDRTEPTLGRRHTYHAVDRNSEAHENAPLLFPLG